MKETWTAKVRPSIAGPRLVTVRLKGHRALDPKVAPAHVRAFFGLPAEGLPIIEGATMTDPKDRLAFTEQLKTAPIADLSVTKRTLAARGTFYLTVQLDTPTLDSVRDELPKLACMKSHGDGSHWGLDDWYPEIEAGLQEALRHGPKARWTTGWYASKKEIASACISSMGNGQLVIEVSVSDDFDTEGSGEVTIKHTTDLRGKVSEAISEAWREAESCQRENRCYEGYSIKHKGQWVETYIAQVGDGHYMDTPPGDNYHEWGWQGDVKIPAPVRAKLEVWIIENGEGSFTFKGWTAESWDKD